MYITCFRVSATSALQLVFQQLFGTWGCEYWVCIDVMGGVCPEPLWLAGSALSSSGYHPSERVDQSFPAAAESSSFCPKAGVSYALL